jgi:hypothetical protein
MKLKDMKTGSRHTTPRPSKETYRAFLNLLAKRGLPVNCMTIRGAGRSHELMARELPAG